MIKKRRLDRESVALTQSINAAMQQRDIKGCMSGEHTMTTVDVDRAIKMYSQNVGLDIDKHSYEEALDCLLAIYKVSCYMLAGPHKLTCSIIGVLKDVRR